MPLIKWIPEMSVGVAELDEQHQGLVALLNRLHEKMMSGQGLAVLDAVLGELLRYAEVHFAAEERLFEQHGYPEALAHQAEHHAFTARVRELQAEVAAGKRFVSLPTLNFLRDWLADHVMRVDMAYKSFFAGRGCR
jgi:hemerythrin